MNAFAKGVLFTIPDKYLEQPWTPRNCKGYSRFTAQQL